MPATKGASASESDPIAAQAPDAPAETAGASPSPEPDATPPGFLPPGVYEYTAPFATVYHLPLTARPADESGPATVFDWAFGCPDDGRWQPTKRKPNQDADNAAPVTPPEV